MICPVELTRDISAGQAARVARYCPIDSEALRPPNNEQESELSLTRLINPSPLNAPEVPRMRRSSRRPW